MATQEIRRFWTSAYEAGREVLEWPAWKRWGVSDGERGKMTREGALRWAKDGDPPECVLAWIPDGDE